MAEMHLVTFILYLLSIQVLWKSYIDFEIEQEEFGNTRNLYKRLLQRTQHVKVRTASWLSPGKNAFQTWKELEFRRRGFTINVEI